MKWWKHLNTKSKILIVAVIVIGAVLVTISSIYTQLHILNSDLPDIWKWFLLK